MLKLNPGQARCIEIRPRWPSKQVRVDQDAFGHLVAVQVSLPSHIQLILTRGYEPPKTSLTRLRWASRRLGIALFYIVYFRRRAEIEEIFGANGHDVDGTHVDVSIAIDGKRLRFLRLGVFTPPIWQRLAVEKHAPWLSTVKKALEARGFRIHQNATESLQIHCDFIGLPE